MKDIFERFGFRKLVFSVAVGNPIEKSYDKMMERYGGRVVGIFKEEFRCYGANAALIKGVDQGRKFSQ